MNRYFCMLDTCDTLSQRVVINIETQINVDQAIAENLCPKLTTEQRIEHAKKEHADYIKRVWVRQYGGFQCNIHVESGEFRFGPSHSHGPDQTIYMKEHEFSHQDHGLHRRLMRGCDKWDMNFHIKGDIQYMAKNIHINNIKNVPPVRQQYYNRSPINHQLVCTMLKHSSYSIYTCSRKCDLHIEFEHDWQECVGALVSQSNDNQREHLRHVK